MGLDDAGQRPYLPLVVGAQLENRVIRLALDGEHRFGHAHLVVIVLLVGDDRGRRRPRGGREAPWSSSCRCSPLWRRKSDSVRLFHAARSSRAWFVSSTMTMVPPARSHTSCLDLSQRRARGPGRKRGLDEPVAVEAGAFERDEKLARPYRPRICRDRRKRARREPVRRFPSRPGRRR